MNNFLIHISNAGGILFLIATISTYIFRESIKQALSRSVQRDIEVRKAEFQKELEKFKSDLEREKDRYRHDLAKDAAKIALYNEKSHELYAQIFELLRRAEGAVGGLHNIHYSPDWEIIPTESTRTYFKNLGASDDIINEILMNIDTDRDAFSKKANAHELRIRLHNTNRAIDEFKNLILLKELYLSDDLNKKLLEARSALYGSVSCFGPFQSPDGMIKSYEQHTKLKPLISDIRSLMQNELKGS